MAAYGIEYVSPVDVTPTWVTEDQWFTCDVSAYVAAGAIAAVFDVGNSASESYIGWRHPDSTDERAFSQEDRSHCMAIVGLNNDGECEFWLDNDNFEVFLVGYIPAEAGEISVNYVDKSTATTDSWQEVDLSGNITGGDGVAAIMFIENTDSLSHWGGVRSTDSDESEFLRAYRMSACQNILTGLDSGESCEQYISDATMDVYYCGAIYDGYISMQNSMTDYSTSTRDSWVDTALSAMSEGDKMAIILGQAGDASPGERYFKVRKDGDTWDFTAAVYGDMVYVLYMAVGTDSAKEIEQYCENSSPYPELYFIGEALEGSSQETYTKTVSLDALIKGTLDETISLDALLYAVQTLTADMDALLLQEGLTESLSLDAILALFGITVSLDAMLKKVFSGTVSLDALVEMIETLDVSLDALLKKVGITTTVSLHAFLTDAGITTSVSLDAILAYFRELVVSLDALLNKVGITSTVSLDAMLVSILEATAKYTFTPDAKPSFTVEARPTFTIE